MNNLVNGLRGVAIYHDGILLCGILLRDRFRSQWLLVTDETVLHPKGTSTLLTFNCSGVCLSRLINVTEHSLLIATSSTNPPLIFEVNMLTVKWCFISSSYKSETVETNIREPLFSELRQSIYSRCWIYKKSSKFELSKIPNSYGCHYKQLFEYRRLEKIWSIPMSITYNGILLVPTGWSILLF